MKKYLIILIMLTQTLFAQTVFVDHVVNYISKEIGLNVNTETRNLGEFPRYNIKKTFSWNTLAYQQALTHGLSSALKDSESLKSLLKIQISGNEENLYQSMRRQSSSHITVYDNAFHPEDFVERQLSPEKIKAIRLNAVKAIKKINEEILNKITRLSRSEKSSWAVINAEKIIKPRIELYTSIYNLIDEADASIEKFHIVDDPEVTSGVMIKNFVHTTSDEIITVIAKISRYI